MRFNIVSTNESNALPLFNVINRTNFEPEIFAIYKTDDIVNALKMQRRNQLEERMKIGAAYQNLDLVFASELGTPVMRRNLINRHFKPLLKKAELKDIRLYDLRHTTASLLLAANEHPKVVQERLGHSSVMITLDTYSHVSPTMQKAANEKLEKMHYGK